ncbi:uncharacterized protein LOC5517900 isoform X2 [Nematostella vectensis]|uniref:uncharacterized protein LOC5517900 isoform X2 n=1 Tax=Nematostella vectensis TaxID=45351 RepID=UPI0020775A0D|nr:uncharacterized protein LOC5517900 isoform X2 [Nematostella vectensis]
MVKDGRYTLVCLLSGLVLCAFISKGQVLSQPGRPRKCDGTGDPVSPKGFKFDVLGNATGLEDCVNLCCEDGECEVAIQSGVRCFGVSCSIPELCHTVVDKVVRAQDQHGGDHQDVVKHTVIASSALCPKPFATSFSVLLQASRQSQDFIQLHSGPITAQDCTSLCCKSKDCFLGFVEDDACYSVRCHGDCGGARRSNQGLSLQVAIIDRKREVLRSVDDDDDDLGSDDDDKSSSFVKNGKQTKARTQSKKQLNTSAAPSRKKAVVKKSSKQLTIPDNTHSSLSDTSEKTKDRKQTSAKQGNTMSFSSIDNSKHGHANTTREDPRLRHLQKLENVQKHIESSRTASSIGSESKRKNISKYKPTKSHRNVTYGSLEKKYIKINDKSNKSAIAGVSGQYAYHSVRHQQQTPTKPSTVSLHADNRPEKYKSTIKPSTSATMQSMQSATDSNKYKLGTSIHDHTNNQTLLKAGLKSLTNQTKNSAEVQNIGEDVSMGEASGNKEEGSAQGSSTEQNSTEHGMYNIVKPTRLPYTTEKGRNYRVKPTKIPYATENGRNYRAKPTRLSNTTEKGRNYRAKPTRLSYTTEKGSNYRAKHTKLSNTTEKGRKVISKPTRLSNTMEKGRNYRAKPTRLSNTTEKGRNYRAKPTRLSYNTEKGRNYRAKPTRLSNTTEKGRNYRAKPTKLSNTTEKGRNSILKPTKLSNTTEQDRNIILKPTRLSNTTEKGRNVILKPTRLSNTTEKGRNYRANPTRLSNTTEKGRKVISKPTRLSNTKEQGWNIRLKSTRLSNTTEKGKIDKSMISSNTLEHGTHNIVEPITLSNTNKQMNEVKKPKVKAQSGDKAKTTAQHTKKNFTKKALLGVDHIHIAVNQSNKDLGKVSSSGYGPTLPKSASVRTHKMHSAQLVISSEQNFHKEGLPKVMKHAQPKAKPVKSHGRVSATSGVNHSKPKVKDATKSPGNSYIANTGNKTLESRQYKTSKRRVLAKPIINSLNGTLLQTGDAKPRQNEEEDLMTSSFEDEGSASINGGSSGSGISATSTIDLKKYTGTPIARNGEFFSSGEGSGGGPSLVETADVKHNNNRPYKVSSSKLTKNLKKAKVAFGTKVKNTPIKKDARRKVSAIVKRVGVTKAIKFQPRNHEKLLNVNQSKSKTQSSPKRSPKLTMPKNKSSALRKKHDRKGQISKVQRNKPQTSDTSTHQSHDRSVKKRKGSKKNRLLRFFDQEKTRKTEKRPVVDLMESSQSENPVEKQTKQLESAVDLMALSHSGDDSQNVDTYGSGTYYGAGGGMRNGHSMNRQKTMPPTRTTSRPRILGQPTNPQRSVRNHIPTSGGAAVNEPAKFSRQFLLHHKHNMLSTPKRKKTSQTSTHGKKNNVIHVKPTEKATVPKTTLKSKSKLLHHDGKQNKSSTVGTILALERPHFYNAKNMDGTGLSVLDDRQTGKELPETYERQEVHKNDHDELNDAESSGMLKKDADVHQGNIESSEMIGKDGHVDNEDTEASGITTVSNEHQKHFYKDISKANGIQFSAKSRHKKGHHSNMDVDDLGDADFDIQMSNDIPHKKPRKTPKPKQRKIMKKKKVMLGEDPSEDGHSKKKHNRKETHRGKGDDDDDDDDDDKNWFKGHVKYIKKIIGHHKSPEKLSFRTRKIHKQRKIQKENFHNAKEEHSDDSGDYEESRPHHNQQFKVSHQEEDDEDVEKQKFEARVALERQHEEDEKEVDSIALPHIEKARVRHRHNSKHLHYRLPASSHNHDLKDVDDDEDKQVVEEKIYHKPRHHHGSKPFYPHPHAEQKEERAKLRHLPAWARHGFIGEDTEEDEESGRVGNEDEDYAHFHKRVFHQRHQEDTEEKLKRLWLLHKHKIWLKHHKKKERERGEAKQEVKHESGSPNMEREPVEQHIADEDISENKETHAPLWMHDKIEHEQKKENFVEPHEEYGPERLSGKPWHHEEWSDPTPHHHPHTQDAEDDHEDILAREHNQYHIKPSEYVAKHWEHHPATVEESNKAFYHDRIWKNGQEPESHEYDPSMDHDEMMHKEQPPWQHEDQNPHGSWSDDNSQQGSWNKEKPWAIHRPTGDPEQKPWETLPHEEPRPQWDDHDGQHHKQKAEYHQHWDGKAWRDQPSEGHPWPQESPKPSSTPPYRFTHAWVNNPPNHSSPPPYGYTHAWENGPPTTSTTPLYGFTRAWGNNQPRPSPAQRHEYSLPWRNGPPKPQPSGNTHDQHGSEQRPFFTQRPQVEAGPPGWVEGSHTSTKKPAYHDLGFISPPPLPPRATLPYPSHQVNQAPPVIAKPTHSTKQAIPTVAPLNTNPWALWNTFMAKQLLGQNANIGKSSIPKPNPIMQFRNLLLNLTNGNGHPTTQQSTRVILSPKTNYTTTIGQTTTQNTLPVTTGTRHSTVNSTMQPGKTTDSHHVLSTTQNRPSQPLGQHVNSTTTHKPTTGSSHTTPTGNTMSSTRSSGTVPESPTTRRKETTSPRNKLNGFFDKQTTAKVEVTSPTKKNSESTLPETPSKSAHKTSAKTQPPSTKPTASPTTRKNTATLSTTADIPMPPPANSVDPDDLSDNKGSKRRKQHGPTCHASDVTDDMTLIRGKRAGNFTKIGDVGDFELCIKRCCQATGCDLAYKTGETCYLVQCHSKSSCQVTEALVKKYSPKMAFIVRDHQENDSKDENDNNDDDNDDDNKSDEKKSPTGIREVCDAESALGISWKETPAGHRTSVTCPRHAKGKAKRKCEADSRWQSPDFSDCVTDEYMQLSEKSRKLAEFADSSPLIRDLAQLTTQTIDNSLIFGGDLLKSVNIMSAIVQHNGQNDLLEVNRDDMQNFMTASSNLLDLTNQQEWHNLQRTKSGSSEVLRAMEMFSLQAAIRLPREEMRSTFITNNIVLKLDRLSSRDGVLVFPDYTDDKIARWDARHDFISIPPSVFSKGEISAASMSYKTLPYILRDTNASSGLGPNSKILSTILHPPPSGKISPPVTIVLGHIKPKRANPKCVFWDYSINPHKGGGWSTRGCWLASGNETHSICQCNHLSNFAVLMDLSDDEVSAKEQKRERTMALMWIGIPVLVVGVIGALYMSFSWTGRSRISSASSRSIDEKTGLLGQRVTTSRVREEFKASPARHLYRALSPAYSPPQRDLEWQDEFHFNMGVQKQTMLKLVLPQLEDLKKHVEQDLSIEDKTLVSGTKQLFLNTDEETIHDKSNPYHQIPASPAHSLASSAVSDDSGFFSPSCPSLSLQSLPFSSPPGSPRRSTPPSHLDPWGVPPEPYPSVVSILPNPMVSEDTSPQPEALNRPSTLWSNCIVQHVVLARSLSPTKAQHASSTPKDLSRNNTILNCPSTPKSTTMEEISISQKELPSQAASQSADVSSAASQTTQTEQTHDVLPSALLQGSYVSCSDKRNLQLLAVERQVRLTRDVLSEENSPHPKVSDQTGSSMTSLMTAQATLPVTSESTVERMSSMRSSFSTVTSQSLTLRSEPAEVTSISVTSLKSIAMASKPSEQCVSSEAKQERRKPRVTFAEDGLPTLKDLEYRESARAKRQRRLEKRIFAQRLRRWGAMSRLDMDQIELTDSPKHVMLTADYDLRAQLCGDEVIDSIEERCETYDENGDVNKESHSHGSRVSLQAFHRPRIKQQDGSRVTNSNERLPPIHNCCDSLFNFNNNL